MKKKANNINGRILKEQENIRYQKLVELQTKNYDIYHSNWKRNFNSLTLQNKFADLDKDALVNWNLNNQNYVISLAGRVRLIRDMGKSIFATLQDQNGKFQIYLKEDFLKPEDFKLFKNSDVGDFFGIKGQVMRTNKGELTIKVSELQMLAKALRPLPDKWQGMNDIEERYRRRYLDLIINDDSKEVFYKRTKILEQIRTFLNKFGYLEVETPILQHIYGGAAAKPFVTYHNTLSTNLYLRIATELHLKRLIVGGFEGVYEIGRIFRNEGMSPRHNPEFTSLELYVAYEDMRFMMELTENLIKDVIYHVNGSYQLNSKYLKNGQLIPVSYNFDHLWTRITMMDSLKNYQNDNFSHDFNIIYNLIKSYETSSDENFVSKNKAKAFELGVALAKKCQIKFDKFHNSIGHLVNLFFEEFIEPTLIEPTFIYSYPVEISPLSKMSNNNNSFTDRFELFIGGREYANAFSELNNPLEQYQRFAEQVNQKKHGDEEATSEIDHDYIDALEYGMPPTAGLGLGIDRLVMLLTQKDSIKDVLLFPHLKLKHDNN